MTGGRATGDRRDDDGPLAEAIGEAVRSARVGLGLTHVQVAEAVGCSARHIGRIEIGLSLPDVVLLRELAEYLGFSVDEVLAPAAMGSGPVSSASKATRELEERLRRARPGTIRVVGTVLRKLIPRV